MVGISKNAQKEEGSYFFNGKFLVTQKVENTLSREEFFAIYQDIQAFVKEKDGIDYLQVYVNKKGVKLFFIKQLNREMIESGDYKEEHNYCTLLYPDER